MGRNRKFFKFDPARLYPKMYTNPDGSPMTMIDHQHLITESVANYENTVVAASRRGGKTKTASAIVVAKFLEPNTETMVLAPQHSLTENIFFNNVYRFLRDKEIELKRANLKDRIIEGANGSILYARSLQRATSIVGVGLDLAVLDEIALTEKDDFWEQELRPTLTEKQGHTLWISTPRGFNHFKFKFDMGESDLYPDWNSIRYTIWDLPYISNAQAEKLKGEYIQSGRESYFRQEFEASFEAFEGQIYSIQPIVENFDRDREWEIVIAGLDIGFQHETAMIVVGVNDSGFFILDYYAASHKTTEQHAEKVQELEEKYNIDVIYIDSAAAQTAWDFAVQYNISTMKAIKHVNEGIAFIQTLLGSKKLYIHESLWEETSPLRVQFSTYQWQEDKDKPVKLNDDLMDAMRYAIYSFGATYNLID